jgi:peptidoglycan hydrolase-like protein with peptidoglycan-binding domain
LGSRPIEQTQGEDVYQVQVMLSNLGFYEGSEDGVLNDATIDAIRAFRRQAGLEDLPLLDDATLRSLLSRHREWKKQAPETPRSSTPEVETEMFPAPSSNPN